MIVGQELVDMYEGMWEREQQAEALKSQASEIVAPNKETLKEFGETNEINVKVLTIGFEHFKKLKAKKIPIEDDSYFAVINKIESEFLKESEGE